MIIRQIILKQLRCTKVEEILPATPIAVYSEAELETLLSGDSPTPEGIRLHFDKPAGAENVVGLIAASLGLVGVDSTTVKNLELATGNKRYMQRGATTANLSASEFNEKFPSFAFKGSTGNNSVCVFFSRTDLREILDLPGVTRIAFFPGTIQRNFTGTAENYATLIAVGQTSTGINQTQQYRSEMPCPPHCGDDYP